MGEGDSTTSFTLFVRLPNQETVTLRHLPKRQPVKSLVAKLELLASIPASCFRLWYGERHLGIGLAINFNAAGDIRNGACVRLELVPQYGELHECLNRENLGRFLSGGDEELNTQPNSGDDGDIDRECRAVLVLCACCKTGDVDMMKDAAVCAANLSAYRTPFGRSLLHLAAANDQVKVLDFLLSCHDLDLFVKDIFCHTCVDVAGDYQAQATERFCRNFVIQRRKSKKKQATKTHVLEKGQSQSGWQPEVRNCLAAAHSGPHRSTSAVSFKLVSADPDPNDLVSPKVTPHLIVTSPKARSPKVEVYDDKKGLLYKKMKRAKSAPPRTQITLETEPKSSRHKVEPKNKVQRPIHKVCDQRKPFMAYRTVIPEELRPVSVEFVPLETRSYAERQVASGRERPSNAYPEYASPRSVPSAPCSSLNNSLEDIHLECSDGDSSEEERMDPHKQQILQGKRELEEKYSNVKGITYRAQSAKYYRTQYHLEAEEDKTIPKPRPKTAGPRYREWKTWLAEKMKQDEERALLEQERVDRRRENIRAFEKWLNRKDRQAWNAYHLTESDSESSGNYDSENEKAFNEWMCRKKGSGALSKLDSKRKQELKNKENPQKDIDIYGNKRLTIYEIGCTDPTPIVREDPNEYMRAFHSWKDKKERFESWRRRKGMSNQNNRPCMSNKEVDDNRGALLMDGMTYEEWLGQKEREKMKAGRSHVYYKQHSKNFTQ